MWGWEETRGGGNPQILTARERQHPPGALPSQISLFKEHPQLEKPARGFRSWMQRCSLSGPAGRELRAALCSPFSPTLPAFSGQFSAHRALRSGSKAEQSTSLSSAPRAGDAGSRYLTQTNISRSRRGSFRVSTCQAGPDSPHHLPPQALTEPVQYTLKTHGALFRLVGRSPQPKEMIRHPPAGRSLGRAARRSPGRLPERR